MVDLPALAVVKNVSAKVVEGTATRAVQSIKLQQAAASVEEHNR
jgi:hypothetical protein